MRTFVLLARRARTSHDFSLEDLPGAGRIDLVTRCISATLFISHAIRTDTQIFCVLNGPPRPPITILFDGSRLKKVSPDERGIAIWIQKALALDIGKHWKERSPGIGVAALAFQDIIRMLRNRPIYVLHEHGRKIQDVDILADPVFVLGDHLGLPRAEERFALRYATDKVSLGKISYLSSTCISLLHWICDLRRI